MSAKNVKLAIWQYLLLCSSAEAGLDAIVPSKEISKSATLFLGTMRLAKHEVMGINKHLRPVRLTLELSCEAPLCSCFVSFNSLLNQSRFAADVLVR